MRNLVISFHVDFKSSEIQKKNNTLSSLQYINILNFPPMLKLNTAWESFYYCPEFVKM